MKKPLLFTALSTLILGLNAQITITNSNFLDVGETNTQATDTNASFSSIPAGANQTWNFSSLSADYQTIITGKNPAVLPGGVNHPTANFAVEQINTNGSSIIYIKRDNSIFEMVGGEFSGLNIQLLNPQTVLEFPITFGNTFNDNYTIEIPAGSFLPIYDSLKVVNQGSVTATIDGWGTLTTPLGTIPVIRLFKRDIVLSITFGRDGQQNWNPVSAPSTDTSYQHTYYSNDPATKFPVLEYSTNPSGTSTFNNAGINFLSQTHTPLSFNNIEKEINFIIFPNPTTDVIQLLSETPIEQIELLDLNGKNVSPAFEKGQELLNISHLAKGIYTLNVQMNGVWSSQKITKN